MLCWKKVTSSLCGHVPLEGTIPQTLATHRWRYIDYIFGNINYMAKLRLWAHSCNSSLPSSWCPHCFPVSLVTAFRHCHNRPVLEAETPSEEVARTSWTTHQHTNPYWVAHKTHSVARKIHSAAHKTHSAVHRS